MPIISDAYDVLCLKHCEQDNIIRVNIIKSTRIGEFSK